MKFSIALLLCTVGLGAAAPPSEIIPNRLEQRDGVDKDVFCGEPYTGVGHRALHHQLKWLRGEPSRMDAVSPTVLFAYPLGPTRINCWGKNGIYIFVESGNTQIPVIFDPKDIANQILYAFKKCNADNEPANELVGTNAFKYVRNGWHIMVHGDQENCGGN